MPDRAANALSRMIARQGLEALPAQPADPRAEFGNRPEDRLRLIGRPDARQCWRHRLPAAVALRPRAG